MSPPFILLYLALSLLAVIPAMRWLEAGATRCAVGNYFEGVAQAIFALIWGVAVTYFGIPIIQGLAGVI